MRRRSESQAPRIAGTPERGLTISSAPHLRQYALEIPADHKFDLFVRVATANERLGERVEPQRVVEILHGLARVDAIALVGSGHEAAELVAIGDVVVALQPEVASDAGMLD